MEGESGFGLSLAESYRSFFEDVGMVGLLLLSFVIEEDAKY